MAKVTFTIKASYKESESNRLERIRMSGAVGTRVLPNKKVYTRKLKHKGSWK